MLVVLGWEHGKTTHIKTIAAKKKKSKSLQPALSIGIFARC